MKIVKAAVILMGVLIILGMGLLVYGFVTRVGKAPEAGTTGDQTGSAAPLVPLTGQNSDGPDSGNSAAQATFGDVSVNLEAGEIVVEMQVSATRLLLRTKAADGTETVRVFDLSTGAPLGRFVIAQ